MTMPTNEEMKALADAAIRNESLKEDAELGYAARSWVPWAMEEIALGIHVADEATRIAKLGTAAINKLNSENDRLRADNNSLRKHLTEGLTNIANELASVDRKIQDAVLAERDELRADNAKLISMIREGASSLSTCPYCFDMEGTDSHRDDCPAKPYLRGDS